MSTLRQSFFNHLAQTSQSPPAFEMVRAEGCYIYDSAGKKYLDLIAGISVSSLGHNNTRINEAIKRQLDQHLHLMVYGEFVISPQVELAHFLSQNLPVTLQSVYLTNSGAEATEGAMKLAKRYTGRTGFVSFRNSYHGSTQGALSLCGSEEMKRAFRPLLTDCRLLEYNSSEQLEFIDQHTAAVFVEPVQAEAGVILPQKDFLKRIRQRCYEVGTLLVFDEIQSGMGRTGSLFAFEQLEVVPDILLLGKAFGGGLPLGAFVASKNIMSTLTFDPPLGHLTTTGGHPLSCAAAFESLKILTTTNIIQEIKAKENLFRNLLVHKQINSFRALGLLCAIEFKNSNLNQKIIERCYQNGLLTDWFLFAPHCLRIAPPLIISKEEIENACRIILVSIDEAVNSV